MSMTRYMRPNTHHYVLTVDDAVTFGRHLYTSSTAQATSFGIIHSFILNYAVTNKLHDELFTMLRRMMTMWHIRYEQDSALDVASEPHVPNITTVSGLMDILAIGNLLEIAQIIDRRWYEGGIDPVEATEMAVARWRYRKLQTYFAKRYVVEVGGHIISTLSIFRRSLVEFAAAVVVYKREKYDVAPEELGGSAIEMEADMKDLFRSNHPELLPCLERLIKEDAQYLYWTGPSITIRRRGLDDIYSSSAPGPEAKKTLDFMDTKIFNSTGDEAVDVATEIPIVAKDQNATTSDMVTNDNVSTLPAALPETNLLIIHPQADGDVQMADVADEPSTSTKSRKRKLPIPMMSVLPASQSHSSKYYDATPACCSCSCRQEKKGEAAATRQYQNSQYQR